MTANFKELYYRLNSLVIFRNILNYKTVKNLNILLELLKEPQSDDKIIIKIIKAYSEFVASLYNHHNNLSSHILKLTLEDENIYMIQSAQKQEISKKITDCLFSELDTLQEISRVSSNEIKNYIQKTSGYEGFLPDWDNLEYDFKAEYTKRIENISKYGYGIYAEYYMFMVKDENIFPVKNPDEVKLSELIGYKTQRQLIIDNTLALIKGKPAHNVLLSGDAGTGKSSSVKAIANEYRNMGLRIVEIRKDQLRDIPIIIDNLSKNPLKFILFIDDLSFAGDDDNFGALKAILEGSVSAKADNIAIYATSNRRHLVRESFSDRDGDDVHRNDTIQEIISLSERFGLRITFSKPNKYEYLDIVKGLVDIHGINIDEEKLEMEAERFAIERHGRSARVAKQFINSLLSKN